MRAWSETNRWIVAIAIALVLAIVIVGFVQSGIGGGSVVPMILMGIVAAGIFTRTLRWLGLLGFGDNDQ